MSGSSPFDTIKDMTGGQWAALIKKIGGPEAVRRILSNEVEVQLIKRQQALFDKNGRRIPPKGMEAECVDPDPNCGCFMGALKLAGLAKRLVRYQTFLESGPVMSAADFEGKVNELRETLRCDRRIAGLNKGCCLPIIIPPISAWGDDDYYSKLSLRSLSAVERSCKQAFGARHFSTFDFYSSQVTVVDPSHQRLIERLKRGRLVGLFFPTALQGFSAEAARQQTASLPPSLHLAGGFDTMAAIAMYPDVLGKGSCTTRTVMATLRDNEKILYFGPEDKRIGIYAASTGAAPNFSAGLLYYAE